MTTRRTALRSMGAIALLIGRSQLAFGASIVAVRVWPAADYTRVTIESDAPLAQKHFIAENPNRLVIDVDGLELSPALRDLVGKVRADDPFIAGVRAGQNQPRVVRIVIDLKQATAPQLFTLAPVAAYQHRLVFDLYPTQERDPLLALIRDKEASEREAAKSVQDALGEFIGKIDGKPAPVPPFAAASTPPLRPPVVAAVPPTGQTPVPLTPALQGKIDRLIVVAIDAGHGGEDPGASGPSGLHEKDVVLQIAKQLRDRIDSLPNMRAMLTRDADFFVPLHDRVRKAQRVQADLFVSIHADAFITPQARGASVFALSQGGATSAAARWMANRENQADLIGGVNITAKDASVMRALLDMSTTAQIRDSMKLGGEVLGQIGRVGKLHKGSVEQAGFAVLKAPDIPSILVEAAFISNPDEESKLRDPGYQARLVHALATGIQRYFAKNPPLARSRQL
ncbi:MAG: N-acetylmuramoyl-L-alanine amidase [Burkholderiales bacterium]